MSFVKGLYSYYDCLDIEWKIAAAVLGIVFSYIMYRRYQLDKIMVSQAIASVSIVVYLFLVFASTVFSRETQAAFDYKLILFWSYQKILQGSKTLLRENIYNIVMLMPVGCLLPIAVSQQRRKRNDKQIIAIGCLCSVLIELLQLVMKRGLFEFDDIFHNTLGMWIGYWIYYKAHWRIRYSRCCKSDFIENRILRNK